MTAPRIRVVKVGGSLLDFERLPELLANWLANLGQPNNTDRAWANVFVAGGGSLVDEVRQFDQRFGLDAETAHWMSVKAMSCTARLLARLINVGQPTQRWEAIRSVVGEGGCSIVFDVYQWLAEVEPSAGGVRLTHDWRTTSDSIAARLAVVLGADELVLLKSTDKPPTISWDEATELGLVDEHFPRVVADPTRVRWFNLRRFDGRSPALSRRLIEATDSRTENCDSDGSPQS